MKATVLVRPKQGILDPQGRAVEAALGHLGFAVADARVGRLVELEVDAADPADARAQVERMCEQLLANPLIESYEIEISAPWPAAVPAGRSPAPPPPDAAEGTVASGAVPSTVPSAPVPPAAPQETEIEVRG